MLGDTRPAHAFPPTPDADANTLNGQEGVEAKPSQADDFLTDAAIIDTPTTPSSSTVLSRFEFESGKGNEGTKVLLIEWEAGGQEWTIDWDGKANYNMLAVGGEVEGESDDAEPAARRVYFLMPPGALIPPLVKLTSNDNENDNNNDKVLFTKPMPAIYPARLGSGDSVVKRGVLHTLWAQRRLADLRAEIDAEMKANSESIGLHIMFQEQDWISDHFGVGERSGLSRDDLSYVPYHLQHEQHVQHTNHPTLSHVKNSSLTARSAKTRSPIGGKLGEKLKGLKLATSPSQLAASQARTTASTARRTLPHTSVDSTAGTLSLDAVLQGTGPATAPVHDSYDGEDELFALPLSPRSPEMAKSPFSLL